MNCAMCKTELTKMETGCMRCLTCKPVLAGPAPIKKDAENRRVDEPWTQERIWDTIEDKVRAAITDELENWHIGTTVHKEKMDLKLTDVAIPDSIDPQVVVAGGGEIPEDVVIPNEPPKWTDQAEELGISWRGRKKLEVLDDIEAKLIVSS